MESYDHLLGRRLIAAVEDGAGRLTLRFEGGRDLTVAGDWDVFASEPLLSVTFSTAAADGDRPREG
jgi:hypothetical protein